MPPRGVKKGTKRARQYEHIKKSEKKAAVADRPPNHGSHAQGCQRYQIQ